MTLTKTFRRSGLLVLAAWRDFTGGDEPSDDRTLIVLRIGSEVGDD